MNLKTTLVLLAFSCLTGCLSGSSTDIDGILGEQESVVSECGGFQEEESFLDYTAQDSSSTEINCSQEKLLWWYDELTWELKLLHTCVVLNCCGIRDIVVDFENGVYQVVERDDPEPGRCDCICPFDFAVIQKKVEPGTITLRLRRTSEDCGDTEIWQGNINLLKLTGEIIIKKQ